MVFVERFFKVAVILLVVVAVATILITPDPSDDVAGVLHAKHSPISFTLFATLLKSLPLPVARVVSRDSLARREMHPDLLDLVCARLC